MSIEFTFPVTEIQRFCMHDGPGIRTTVFFKGCPLRCAWCHNPETQQKKPQLQYMQKQCIGCCACVAVCPNGVHKMENGEHLLHRESCTLCGACASACPARALETCGKEMTADEILKEAEKDRAFYGKEGGITLSGGEPFLQGEKLIQLLRACKERGLTTAVETCGFADPDLLVSAVPFVDLFLYDVKDTDEKRHKHYTGVSNQKIQDNLRLLDKQGAKTLLRCILVSGVNTDPAHYHALADLYHSLFHCKGIELLPYHAFGGAKSTFLGLPDSGNPAWIPTEEQMEEAKALLQARQVTLIGK
jgi:pyruvate formate lyase activating enzyme